jgi:hypothetical protein
MAKEEEEAGELAAQEARYDEHPALPKKHMYLFRTRTKKMDVAGRRRHFDHCDAARVCRSELCIYEEAGLKPEGSHGRSKFFPRERQLPVGREGQ